MAKKKLSAKQKAALKKGQAALKKWRSSQKKRSTSSTRKKKSTVSKRKNSTVKTKSVATTKSKKRIGGSMKRKGRNAVKRVTRTVQSFARKSNMAEMLQDSALVIISGITSGFLTSKIPIADGRIRSVIPIGGGLAVAALSGKKNRIAYNIGKGMVILGALSLFKQLAPGVPMLAGERVIILPPQSNSMGRRVVFPAKGLNMGRRVKFAGYNTTGYKTAANT